MIIKYVLTSDGTIPDYVEDGGYFVDPDDATEAKIGKAVASGIPSDAPATTVSISKSDLIDRVQSIKDRYPAPQLSPLPPTDDPVNLSTATETVDAWCIQVGEV
tara:strand:+ start:131 stop:442 length:312 start_codon:yes stop_codon:yes gene_type:complete